jgi:hypothetical protein
MSKYLTRIQGRGTQLYPGRGKRKTCSKIQNNVYNVNNIYNEYTCNKGYNKNIINTPQNRSRLLYPVLVGSTWSNEINRRTIIISMSIIMKVKNLDILEDIHETLSGVLARQAKVQFHFIRGMNVAWSQHFVAEKFDCFSVKAVTNNLLSVIR